VPCRDHTSKALRYGTRSQAISQFYLHTPHLSANGINHTCLCLPSRSWYSFTDPGRMEGWVGRYCWRLTPSYLSRSIRFCIMQCTVGQLLYTSSAPVFNVLNLFLYGLPTLFFPSIRMKINDMIFWLSLVLHICWNSCSFLYQISFKLHLCANFLMWPPCLHTLLVSNDNDDD